MVAGAFRAYVVRRVLAVFIEYKMINTRNSLTAYILLVSMELLVTGLHS